MAASLVDSGQRCLFVRSDSYGDLIAFEPMLRAASAALGEGNVALLMRQRFRDLQPLLPAGVKFIYADINPYRSGPADNATELARVIDEVGRFDPQAVIVPAVQETWLDLYVAAMQSRARRIKHGETYVPVDLRHQLREVIGAAADSCVDTIVPPQGETELDRIRQLAHTLFGAEIHDAWVPHCRVPDAALRAVATWRRGAALESVPYAVVFPAGVSNVSIKRWPAERFARIAHNLEKRNGLTVVVAGHVDESAIVDEVADQLRGGGARPVRWLGEAGQITELAALLAGARLYFGNDTGPMHLAAAVGTPVVGIFGGGHWPRFAPGGGNAIAIAHPLPCNGCDWDCIWSRPHCVDLVDESSVERAIDEVLRGGGGSRIEIASALNAETMQYIADAARMRQRERDRAAARIAAYFNWAVDERRRRRAAEHAQAEQEMANAAARAWAEQERALREQGDAARRAAEALLESQRRQAQEQRQQIEAEAARLVAEGESMRRQSEAELAAARASFENEKARRESAEARLLVNRLRRLFRLAG